MTMYPNAHQTEQTLRRLLNDSEERREAQGRQEVPATLHQTGENWPPHLSAPPETYYPRRPRWSALCSLILAAVCVGIAAGVLVAEVLR